MINLATSSTGNYVITNRKFGSYDMLISTKFLIIPSCLLIMLYYISSLLVSNDIILHGLVGGIEKFAHVVVIISNHECGNIFQYPSQAAKPRVMGIGKYYHTRDWK